MKFSIFYEISEIHKTERHYPIIASSRPEGPQPRSRGPEGPYTSSESNIATGFLFTPAPPSPRTNGVFWHSSCFITSVIYPLQVGERWCSGNTHYTEGTFVGITGSHIVACLTLCLLHTDQVYFYDDTDP